MAYNKDTDYQAIINEAVARKDYQTAALAEQARNEKIADMDASGTNKYGATATDKYSSWLDFGGSATGVGVHTTDQASIRDQMNANSKAWWTADDATRTQLEAANQQLAAQLGSGVTYNAQTGTWSGTANEPENLQPTFNYSTYQASNPQPTYTSNYDARIDELLNQILNREGFSYNAETDDLYQQYKTQYNREGNRSMNDTLASLASGAGGMNSYAITAAQQANDYYAAQLGDKIPELYQLAYDMYLTDIDNQVRDLGLLQSMDDTQYSRYRDTMSDWRNDRDFAYNQYRDQMGDYQWEKNFDYNVGRDQIADTRYDNEWDYAVGRDDIEDSRYENETAYNRALELLSAGVMPEDSLLTSAGLSASTAQELLNKFNEPQTSGSSGSSGGSGKSGDTGGIWDTISGMESESEVRRYLLELGISDSKISSWIKEWKNNQKPTEVEEEDALGDRAPDEGTLIGGKPLEEYEAASGNYMDVAAMAEQLMSTEGKDAVLQMLREAYQTGVLNVTDYSSLYNKYRG